MFETIAIIVVLITLLIASYIDIKIKEVPDWLSYSLMFFAVGLRLIFYVNTTLSFYLLEGLYGFIFLFIIAYIMYYTGQWGGGDSKLLMGIGALIGMNVTSIGFLITFFMNLILFGAFYGLIWTIVLAVLNWEKFSAKFNSLVNHHKTMRILVLILSLVFVLSSFYFKLYQAHLILLAGIVIVFYYTLIFSKAVELSIMLKVYPVSKLVEGDWIAKDVVIGGKKICSTKDVGITINQINILKKLNVKEVLVKEGIPFIPSFLIAFIATLIMIYILGWNWSSLLTLLI